MAARIKVKDTSEKKNRRLTRKDVHKAAEPLEELGPLGQGRRNRHAQFRDRLGHRRRGAPGAQRQGHLARARLRPERPAGRQDQVPGARPFQSDPHDDAHRHRRVFRRARPPQDPRHRRHHHHAAAVRHAVGRPRPHHVLRPHVERLRLPQRDVRRRAEGRHREDARRRWSGRGVLLDVRARWARNGCPTASPSPTRCWISRRRSTASKCGAATSCWCAPATSSASFAEKNWDGYSGGDAPGFAFETLDWLHKKRGGRRSSPTPGARKCGPTRPKTPTSRGTGSRSRSWASRWARFSISRDLAKDCAEDGRYEFMFVRARAADHRRGGLARQSPRHKVIRSRLKNRNGQDLHD